MAMLEVNDFNAIRISLASPEQILSWSYGEVTKPETINYRTLKPEKDGLFDERIFGPTKDFECYCGKYKRAKHKGIVCERCGVEVTRSKVRRERMGHIMLAAPVAHLWFFKGTPSRLGLLLDISPRSLERVLYFAQYIIIEVDEERKADLLAKIRAEFDQALEARRQELAAAEAEVNAWRDAELNRLAAELEANNAEAERRRDETVRILEAEFAAARDLLREGLGRPAPAAVSFRGQALVGAGESVSESHLAELADAYRRELERAADEYRQDLERYRALYEAGVEQVLQEAGRRLGELQARFEAARAELEERLADKEDELRRLRPRELLTEMEYAEFLEKYGDLFRAGMGAEAILEIVRRLDLDRLREELRQEINSSSGQRRKKATKRLRVVEAFRQSGNRPEWMILTVLPVLPPDLRPMVQLDGGRFATSDLNDLYRRVINRNNRLKRLMELGAPEIIIRNEKRMLQEAVDSLIDNGRRGRAVAGAGQHKLKSLSDMLRGKQGRFRQNLLGKRVDYSGRSVIVVGPELKLHQCGLPKRMALELFKPFVMHKLVEHGYAHNIKSAKRIVERVKPEVWDVLEEVIKTRPVLLNRAPTLHRLGIQAFEPVLVEGSAIKVHPLVCTAFNADFDGDQMAVHVPLSKKAVEEAREVMLSSKNLLSPSSGEPIAAPTLDMVLGCYYLTLAKPEGKGAGRFFSDFDEAKLAYMLGELDLHAEIYVREGPGKPIFKTTVGRIIFNEVLPPELRFRNEEMDKKALRQLVADCYRVLGNDRTAQMLDELKALGFRLATQAGISIAVADVRIPKEKSEIIKKAEENIQKLEALYRRGLITDQERYEESIRIWEEATEEITRRIEAQMDKWTSVYMMATSGAKGNIAQIRQMGGMRGLMSDPTGRIIDLPIISNFREGLSVLEYFISTHGARKGLADTALRTADSGYLTRRLVDVAQDIIVREEDCGTNLGIWITQTPEDEMLVPFSERILGRYAALPIQHPETGEVLVEANQEIDEEAVERVSRAGITQVYVRSPLTCQARYGLCRYCYGRDLARRRLVELGEAVGIIAAQSIGEPGTQLTMRTFHTGGIAQQDITTGLPRVEELFEARTPKNPAVVAEIDGVVDIIEEPGGVRKLKIISSEVYPYELTIPPDFELAVSDGDYVPVNTVVARRRDVGEETLPALPDAVLYAPVDGTVRVLDGMVVIHHEERDEREYEIPAQQMVRVEPGQRVKAGDQLTDGVVRPQDILRIQGREAVQLYLVREIQKVYRQQGVNINDKHIEVIVRQMLRKVQVESPGDTDLLPGELVDRFAYEEINARVLAEGGEPATAKTVLLGITKASLTTDSWLAAASFQETTRVLTEAAVKGAVDRLIGLKENVIIGRLIPAGTGFRARQLARLRQAEERLALGEPFGGFEGEGGALLPGLDTASS